jgi:hypothetical protein
MMVRAGMDHNNNHVSIHGQDSRTQHRAIFDLPVCRFTTIHHPFIDLSCHSPQLYRAQDHTNSISFIRCGLLKITPLLMCVNRNFTLTPSTPQILRWCVCACQALRWLEAASYVGQSRKGCMGTSIPPLWFLSNSRGCLVCLASVSLYMVSI